jgi:ABC-type taurine transport system substrate-binding protein
VPALTQAQTLTAAGAIARSLAETPNEVDQLRLLAVVVRTLAEVNPEALTILENAALDIDAIATQIAEASYWERASEHERRLAELARVLGRAA